MSGRLPVSRIEARPWSKQNLRKYPFVSRSSGTLVVNRRRRFVAQALPGRQQSAAKLRVFVAQLATRAWPQIESKATMLFKHLFPKSHVGAERRLVELNRLQHLNRIEPECLPCCWVHRVATTAEVKRFFPEVCVLPAPAHALPSRAAVKLRSQFFSTITSSSIKARISPCASRIPAFRACDFPGLDSNKYRNRPGCRRAEILDDLACLIARVIVYHQNFPNCGARHF